MGTEQQLCQYLTQHRLTALEGVQEKLILRRYAAGEYLCHAGDTIHSFTILVDGRCKIIPHSEDGKEVLLDYMDPVSFNGDIELLNDCPALYSVCAVGAVTVIVIPRDVFFHTVMENKAFLKIICEQFARKLYASSWNYSQSMLYPLRNRLCRFLLEQMHQQNTTAVKVKSRDLAQKLGITERHLRRVLTELEAEGLLVRRQGILECNQKRLEAEQN